MNYNQAFRVPAHAVVWVAIVCYRPFVSVRANMEIMTERKIRTCVGD